MNPNIAPVILLNVFIIGILFITFVLLIIILTNTANIINKNINNIYDISNIIVGAKTIETIAVLNSEIEFNGKEFISILSKLIISEIKFGISCELLRPTANALEVGAS